MRCSAINQAQNFAEFREAAALLAAPSQNLVYADVEGNIGYQLPGMAPRRGKGDGRTPSPGWDEAYDWRGDDPVRRAALGLQPAERRAGCRQPAGDRRLSTPTRSARRTPTGGAARRSSTSCASSALTLDQAEELFYDDTIRIAADLVPGLLKIKVADRGWPRGSAPWSAGTTRRPPDSAAAAYFNVVCTTSSS